ncbi:hypothetical protein QR680_001110 [Steinernema hermaphroditum]|uniref:Uncharacterized protein n=1 Tax=Steinernema hermaphroditum TaxID=289476 RepID=A0AA39LF87_9BILA|nr:hypothetical protein QR680_001110 [Steinernema hermaphroditum]
MDAFFRQTEEFTSLYDCSNFSEAAHPIKERQNVILGSVYMFLGSVYIIFYLPCLVVMTKPNLMRYSCFKFMLVLGIIDVVTVTENALITGYLEIVGGVYCTYPNFIYMVGCLSLGLWCCACMLCIILAFNRCVDMCRPDLTEKLFGGFRTYMWFALAFCYWFYFVAFTKPLIFTGYYAAWFFDPFVGMDVEPNFAFSNFPHTANNVTNIVVLSGTYGFLCILLFKKSRMSNSAAISRVQKQIFVQSCSICMLNMTAAVIYVYMQFFVAPPFVVVIGQLTWQAAHGAGSVIYITMNKTIRRGVFNMITCRFSQVNQLHTISMVPKSTNNPTESTHPEMMM